MTFSGCGSRAESPTTSPFSPAGGEPAATSPTAPPPSLSDCQDRQPDTGATADLRPA